MKKAGIILLAVILLMTGCTGAGGDSSGASADASSSGSGMDDTGFVFVSGGALIAMHAPAAAILDQLGEPKEYFEAPSCAFQGIEKTYVYTSFSLYTYELEGADHVASIVILDDSITTKEGVSIGDPLSKVTSVYGDGFVKSVGLYTYETKTMKLNFIVADDSVTSIEYVALAGE
ncbi:MAG: hypothetical protein ACYC5K_10650 [Saccharofermentanales bacterium]